MKISRFLKTILMTDFIGGLFIALRELFKSKKKLLDNGDRWENVLAANIRSDNPYR